ncbi:uncharacterized protein LOC127776489 isoform X2 [Oryza glaberrima]|uniref:uncharacterized protein LOC127776489 isoform X2 n=1 Tax=Oryza glaberrima TaxID=4538 RepID=UPI00224BE806|nr:uncharacterized protein LOC127776489 isoform X2 [Oryza glaberrima]
MEMIGYKIHKIKKPEDFTALKARTEAKRRWLTDEEYLAILLNTDHYLDLLTLMPIQMTERRIMSPEQAVLYLFNMDTDTNDGLIEFKVTETESAMKVKDTAYLKMTSTFNENVEKRVYALRSAADRYLVHYRPNEDARKIDMVTSSRAAGQLMTDIDAYSESSGKKKKGILGKIRNRGSSTSDGGGRS